jgi:PilZ domain
MIERRKHPRENIHYRVFYECLDAKDKNVSQDMGTALDISEKGLLLETSLPVHAATIKVTVPVKDKNAIQVMGNVIYSLPLSDKCFRTGIIFHESGHDNARLVELLSKMQ